MHQGASNVGRLTRQQFSMPGTSANAGGSHTTDSAIKLQLALQTPQSAPAGGLKQLADRRPVPDQFTDTKALLEEEGASYYWL